VRGAKLPAREKGFPPDQNKDTSN
jgi:hypothetical protein